MSVEVLRQAASLMRERAQAATPGWWIAYQVPGRVQSDDGDWVVDADSSFVCSTHIDTDRGRLDAEHIAAADPPFILAVADWLDAVVDRGAAEMDEGKDALTVARAYLGERE